MAGAFAAATEERRTHLRRDLGDALNALRDTSRTFGFEEPARAAEQALGRLAEAATTTLLGTVESLREIINAATEEGAGGQAGGGTTASVQAMAGVAPAASAAAPAQSTAPVAAQPRTAPASAAPAAATAAAAPVVPIEDLLYRGPTALRRILELKPDLEKAVPREDRTTRETIDELFDLVRLAMS
jgi:hypothetical protein